MASSGDAQPVGFNLFCPCANPKAGLPPLVMAWKAIVCLVEIWWRLRASCWGLIHADLGGGIGYLCEVCDIAVSFCFPKIFLFVLLGQMYEEPFECEEKASSTFLILCNTLAASSQDMKTQASLAVCSLSPNLSHHNSKTRL